MMLMALWQLQALVPPVSLPLAAGALAYAFASLVLLRQDMSDMRALLKLRET
jgi:hypothetical protein